MSGHKAHNAWCLSVMALVASSVSIAAQTGPSPSQPAPTQPGPASPAPQAGMPSPKTQSALKLAGLVTFVANACSKLQPNYPRFEEALTALGVAKADLEKADMKAGYLGYAARYNTDVAANCQRADAQFGPQGKTLSGIFAPR